jgi:hypothetical protein
MKRSIALAVFAAAACSSALAGEKGSFADMDTNTSGTLSLAEVRAAAPSVTPETFAAADADANGELTRAEYDAWKASKLTEKAANAPTSPKANP